MTTQIVKPWYMEISRHLTLQTDREQCTPVCAFFLNGLFLRKVNFEKNPGPTQECNNVITPYYPIFAPISGSGPLREVKNKKISNFWLQKVVALA